MSLTGLVQSVYGGGRAEQVCERESSSRVVVEHNAAATGEGGRVDTQARRLQQAAWTVHTSFSAACV